MSKQITFDLPDELYDMLIREYFCLYGREYDYYEGWEMTDKIRKGVNEMIVDMMLQYFGLDADCEIIREEKDD